LRNEYRRLQVKIAISVLAVALAVLLLWRRSNDGHDTRQETVPTQSEPASPVLERVNPGGHSRERPQLPKPEPKVEQPVRVEIDRRPWDPAKESDIHYERRSKLAAAFDRFREDSGISDEKAQAVLALLCDHQETARHVRKQDLDRILYNPYRDEWEFEYKGRETSHTLTLVELDALDALEEILTPEEMRPWRRHMESIAVWNLLNWPYEPPLIVPVVHGHG
jgi:hypothetical protein